MQDLALDSAAIGRKMNVRIILPPDYNPSANRRYPVLYFLHPWGMTPRYLIDKLNFHQHVWNGIQSGTIPPLVVVLPTGSKSFFMNAADPPGHDWTPVVQRDPDFYRDALYLYGRYGDYLIQEVMPTVEAAYHVRTDRDGRAIGGISMGGAGAAVHGFSTSLFGAVGLHSPALFTDRPGRAGPPWIFGTDAESLAARSALDLARRLDPATAPRILLDSGDRDPLINHVELLHETLNEQGIEHDYVVLPGRHDKTFWKPRVGAWLEFYTRTWVNEAV